MYAENIKLSLLFSVFTVFSMFLLPLLSSHVSAGAGFVRFSSLILDITPVQAMVFLVVGVVSTLFLAFSVAALVSIVKVKETLDEAGFRKVVNVFPNYISRVFIFFLVMLLIAVLAGVGLAAIGMPLAVVQLVIVLLWLAVIFTPQVIVLENFSIGKSLSDALQFIKNSPKALAEYIAVGFILILAVLAVEVGLGQIFVWEHRVVSLLLVSFFVLPFLQMYATELYIKRYPVSHM